MHGESYEARVWDSEKRSSPYSTVCDPSEEFCEVCEQDYSDDGECGCN